MAIHDVAAFVPVVIELGVGDAVTNPPRDALFQRRVLNQTDAVLLDVQQPTKQRRVVTHELHISNYVITTGQECFKELLFMNIFFTSLTSL